MPNGVEIIHPEGFSVKKAMNYIYKLGLLDEETYEDFCMSLCLSRSTKRFWKGLVLFFRTAFYAGILWERNNPNSIKFKVKEASGGMEE